MNEINEASVIVEPALEMNTMAPPVNTPITAMGSVPVTVTCVLPNSLTMSPNHDNSDETMKSPMATVNETSSITNNNSINVIKTNTMCLSTATVTDSNDPSVTIASTISNPTANAIVTAVQGSSSSLLSSSTKSGISQSNSGVTTRMVPLIYLQSPVSVKQNTGTNSSGATNNNDTSNSCSTGCMSGANNSANSSTTTATNVVTSNPPGTVQLNMSQVLNEREILLEKLEKIRSYKVRVNQSKLSGLTNSECEIIAGNPQLIHTNGSQANQTFAYLGTLIKQSLKGKETTSQKVLLTPMTVPNKGSQMASVILPAGNEVPTGHSNKQQVASLILQSASHGSSVPSKMNLILPGSTATNPTTGKTSLLLPAPPNNSSGSKKAPLTNIIMPNTVKSTNVPNIIRQSSTSSNSSGSKNPVTSYILPSGSNSTSLIIPTPGVGPKGSNNQVAGLIIPASTSSTSIILPSTTTTSTGQLANLIFTTTPTSLPQTTNTPVNLIMTGSNSAANLLVPSVVTATGSNTSTTTTVAAGKTMTGVFLPVSMPPQGKNTLTHHLTISNGKIHTSSDSSITVSGLKQVGAFSALPPLQPITNKDGTNKVSLLASNKQNIINITSDSGSNITLTPISGEIKEQKDPPALKIKEDKKDSEMEVVEIKIEKTDKTIEIKKEIGTCKDKDYDNREGDRRVEDEYVVLDGEITMRRVTAGSATSIINSNNGADKENTSPDRQSEDEVKIEVVKQERDKSPSLDDFDPIKVLEWDSKGFGKLPGSDLKFRVNEFGMMILHDEADVKEQESIGVHLERKEEKRPHKEPVGDKTKDQTEGGSDEIYCCEGCGCYGLCTEFLDTKFCSIACKKSVLSKMAFNKKREDDKLRDLKLRRKKRKIKILQGKVRKEIEIQTLQRKDPPIDWLKELAELRAKKAARVDNCDDSSKKDILESPNMSEVDISIRSGTTSPTLTDEDHSDKRVPWISKSGEFVWTTYLNHCKAKAAPVKLFKDSFPYSKNGFRVGMKMEAIDPEHQAFICVVSVVEVRGYRIRLHFDGYPENHDFWVNADSPDIFQPGWCEKNNHTLYRPRGYSMDNFNWNLYLKQCKAQPAPRHLFGNRNANPICPNQFRVGMKLEAVDRKNSSLVCVASVADIIDNRLLIHFDSWGDVYDYWADPTSPYIHPINWCKDNGHDLTPPNTFKNPAAFSWDSYLKETKSAAAPARAFKTRPPNGFRQGMKLEAVDKRAPHLIRVATVRDVLQHQIKITFDGFPDHFGYWVEDDSLDIHPIGWAHKTGHSLEGPPVGDEKTECTTPGCKGDGHTKGAKYTSHKHPSVCPYSSQNMNREINHSFDRFSLKSELYEVPETGPFKPKQAATSSNNAVSSDDNSSSVELRSMKTRLSYCNPTTLPDEEKEKEKKEERRGRKRKAPDVQDPSEELNRLRRDLIETVLKPGYQVNPDPPPCWTKHSTTFGLKIDWFQGDPKRWTFKQVSAFINTVHPMRSSKIFVDQEIDGEALLMMTQSDLTDLLGLKLGPAIKIFNTISLLRQKYA